MAQQEKASDNHPPGKGGREGFPDRPAPAPTGSVFVTFTGVDRWTDPAALADLSSRYPVEWGVLWSEARAGVDPRYPDGATVERLLDQRDLMRRGDLFRVAVHLCGAVARAVLAGDAFLPWWLHDVDRVQINAAAYPADAMPVLADLALHLDRPVIYQHRVGPFPATHPRNVFPLFDRSGGRGVAPAAWPRHGDDRLVGYAGGIGPDNVIDVIAAIDARGPYWLDMETGVRTDDRFDVAKCTDVLKAIYGPTQALRVRICRDQGEQDA